MALTFTECFFFFVFLWGFFFMIHFCPIIWQKLSKGYDNDWALKLSNCTFKWTITHIYDHYMHNYPISVFNLGNRAYRIGIQFWMHFSVRGCSCHFKTQVLCIYSKCFKYVLVIYCKWCHSETIVPLRLRPLRIAIGAQCLSQLPKEQLLCTQPIRGIQHVLPYVFNHFWNDPISSLFLQTLLSMQ